MSPQPLPQMNRRWVLASHPDGLPQPEDFALQSEPIAPLAEGEVLVRNRFCSVDPGIRPAMHARAKSYAESTGLGDVIQGAVIGEIVASRNPDLAVGMLVTAGFGWQEYGRSTGRGMLPLGEIGDIPPQAFIGVLGIPGLTAYIGLVRVAAMQPGETVLISSAAGAVGATAGQVARLSGARPVGIAGGGDKCAWLAELGFDAVIDRHAEDLATALDRTCPDGIDIYLDNVGGPLVDLVLARMRRGGRCIISGQISEYSKPAHERHGARDLLTLVSQRIRMEGFVVLDYYREFAAAREQLLHWISSGNLVWKEELFTGMEKAPEAFCGLFTGENFGRRIVQLHD